MHQVWSTESRYVRDMISGVQAPLLLVKVQALFSCYQYHKKKSHKHMKQMVIKGGATWGLRRSTLREGLGKSLGEVCTRNKDGLKRRSYLVEKKMNFVKNHMLIDILGGADLLTLPLSLHPPCT